MFGSELAVDDLDGVFGGKAGRSFAHRDAFFEFEKECPSCCNGMGAYLTEMLGRLGNLLFEELWRGGDYLDCTELGPDGFEFGSKVGFGGACAQGRFPETYVQACKMQFSDHGGWGGIAHLRSAESRLWSRDMLILSARR